MAFYSPDAAMGQRLASLVARLEAAGRPGLAERLAITWLQYPRSPLQDAARPSGAAAPAAGFSPHGASWRGAVLQATAGLERLVYLIAVERWLQRDLLADGPDLRQALEAMARHGSHEATALVLDLLSGTTTGPSLPPARQAAWQRQRQLVNGWLRSLGWPELEGCSFCHRLWQDRPYGRERDLLGPDGATANRCSSDGLARLLAEVIGGSLVSPPACQRLRLLLQPITDQTADRLGHGPALPLPAGLPWWGLGQLPGRSDQLALYGEPVGKPPLLLLVMHPGPDDPTLLAALLADLLAADSPAASRTCRD